MRMLCLRKALAPFAVNVISNFKPISYTHNLVNPTDRIWLTFHSMQQAIPMGVLTLLCCGKQLRRASGGICLKKYEQLSRKENNRAGMNRVMHDLIFAKLACLFLRKQTFVIHRLRIIWLGWFYVCAQPTRSVVTKYRRLSLAGRKLRIS